MGPWGTVDPAHELQLCQDNQDEWFYDPHREALSPDEFDEVLDEYIHDWSNEGADNIICETVGIICEPFTIELSKPCYREDMDIMDTAQECSQQ